MTVNEAYDRAVRIWGAARVSSIIAKGDGGAYISLLPPNPRPMASDTRGRNFIAHSIDANGHTTCHPDCATLEKENC